jgi:hypothetical protein
LVQSIFGRFAFFQIDGKFNKKEHNRLKRGDRTVAGSLGCDMFMKDCQRSRGLANGDEFLCSLCQTVSKRSQSPVSCETMKLTLSTFSGLMWGGGGMLGRPRCAVGYWIDVDWKSGCLSRLLRVLP